MLSRLIKIAVYFGCVAALQTAHGATTCKDLIQEEDREFCNDLHSETYRPSITNGTSGRHCGYHMKRLPCRYTTKLSAINHEVYLDRKDHYWWDHELEVHCNSLSVQYNKHDEFVSKITLSDVNRTRSCRKRNLGRKCDKWKQEVSFKCSFERSKTNFDNKSKECEEVKDYSRAKSCPAAHAADVKTLQAGLKTLQHFEFLYKNEVKLYKNLAKIISELNDAISDLRKVTVSKEQAKLLKELQSFVLPLHENNENLGYLEESLLTLADIIENADRSDLSEESDIEVEVNEDNLFEVERIVANIAVINKELRGKEHIAELISKEIGEINKQINISQRKSR